MVIYPETNKKGTNKTWISTNTTCWKNFLCFPVLRPLCGRGQPAVFPRVCHGRPVLSHGYLPTDCHHSILSAGHHSKCPVASCSLVFSNVETFQYTLHNRTVPLPNNLLRLQLGLCESTDEAAGSSPGQAQPLCPSLWDNCFPQSFDFFFHQSFGFFFFFTHLATILLGLYLNVSVCRY